MLTLFVLWSSLFSLHLIFAPAHSHHQSLKISCNCCHHESSIICADDSELLKNYDKNEDPSCPFCLFASELSNAGTSSIFFLCHCLTLAAIEVEENFFLVRSIVVTKFARGPPDRIA
jgi:hypothetical protein